MIVTDKFVFVHMPKTGGTFVEKVLQRLLGPRTGLYIDTSVPAARFQRQDQHETYSEVPHLYRSKPMLFAIRNPFDHYVSHYEFAWWKNHPNSMFVDEMAKRSYPEYPDISFDSYVYAINQWSIRTHTSPGMQRILEEKGVGSLAWEYIHFIYSNPYKILVELDGVNDEEILHRELPEVHFIRTDSLNRDLYNFLVEIGYGHEDVEFILHLGKIFPHEGGRDASQRWEQYYSQETIDLVRSQERLLFLMFPHFERYREQWDSFSSQPSSAQEPGLDSVLSAGATVLVVSKGDEALVDLPGRRGWHFPRTARGVYAGHYPADSAAAIAHLEELRTKGAGYLLFPAPAFWWLEHYAEFRRHLDQRYRRVWDDDTCLVYDLSLDRSTFPMKPVMSVEDDYSDQADDEVRHPKLKNADDENMMINEANQASTRTNAQAINTRSEMKKIVPSSSDFAPSSSFRHPILLDYPLNEEPRYGYGKPAHPDLYRIINQHRSAIGELLTELTTFIDRFVAIPIKSTSTSSSQPAWINGWLPPLDAIAIYGMIAINDCKRFFEVGSGNSTKFAKRAIIDEGMDTIIASIDPNPRADVDLLCDMILRKKLEDVDLSIFSELEAGDILFLDSSHRVFMNSDVTVLFLDVLPQLQSGVMVHFHDIFLPYDYPPEWRERHYSEQYMLAAHLLAGADRLEIILPSRFVVMDEELSGIVKPVWNEPRLSELPRNGVSFWLRVK